MPRKFTLLILILSDANGTVIFAKVLYSADLTPQEELPEVSDIEGYEPDPTDFSDEEESESRDESEEDEEKGKIVVRAPQVSACG